MDKNGGQPTTRADLLFTAATWRWPRGSVDRARVRRGRASVVLHAAPVVVVGPDLAAIPNERRRLEEFAMHAEQNIEGELRTLERGLKLHKLEATPP
jgi:hypothetical protein